MYAACKEMALFHFKNCPTLNYLYKKNNFNPESLISEKSLRHIPSIGVTAMKYHLLLSIPQEFAALKLTSSGTRGQKTQILFDQGSLDRVQNMLDVYFDQEGFVSSTPNNYFVFNYDPEDAGDLGIAYTEKNQMRFAPVNDSYFAIKKNADGNWHFDKKRAYEKLASFSTDLIPLRIFAMPAFLFEFIMWMKENKLPALKFSPESWIITGGGWKAAEDKKVTRGDFRNYCYESFAIPIQRQRDAYGMAEHCAPYFECSAHRFHIPVFNRLIMRDPITFDEVPNGQVGLMELITPFNAMIPTLSILSTDYGKIHEDKCPCGANSPTFEILGRAGLSKHKGCAITANEIVRRT